MLEIWRDESGPVFPEEAREHLILELAQLSLWLEERIIEKNIAHLSIDKINPEDERASLETPLIQERIENTARNLADGFWKRMVQQAIIRRPLVFTLDNARVAASKRQSSLSLRKSEGVKLQHYSPVFANRYWATAPDFRVREYSRGIDHSIIARDVGYRAWGAEKFLYSQALEKHFHLIEGDAKKPHENLLNIIPLTEMQRRRWIAFLVTQRLRTPRSIRLQLNGLRRRIANERIPYPAETGNLRAVYETLFYNSVVFTRFYHLLMSREWQIWAAPPGEYFLRSDEPVIITGSVDGSDWQLIYPMTPNKCFAVGPGPAPTEPSLRIVPNTRSVSTAHVSTINQRIAHSARLTVIGPRVNHDEPLREMLRVSLALVEPQCLDLEYSLVDYWGSMT
jgi:hypothetical protein